MHLFSLLAAARGRIRALFQRPSVEGELSDEIRFHLEMETEKNIRAGMTPEAARRAAALSFGGVERVREEHRDARGTRLLENVAVDLRYAARTLRKNPGFTTVVALTIMLGIGANAAVFSVAYGVLLRPLPYVESERLVRLWSRNEPRQLLYFSVSPADFAVWRERNRVFESMAAYERQRSVTLTRGNEPQPLDVASISPDVFSVLGTPAVLGRRLTLPWWESWSTICGGRASAATARSSDPTSSSTARRWPSSASCRSTSTCPATRRKSGCRCLLRVRPRITGTGISA
jgi:hypothetical protein